MEAFSPLREAKYGLSDGNTEQNQLCTVCRIPGEARESATVRSNVRRFRQQKFQVYRCESCRSLHSEKVDNLSSYYEHYPMHEGGLNYFFRVWYGIYLKRLVRLGLKKYHVILDYGCGRGAFVDFLKKKGYANAYGFDPFSGRFRDAAALERRYDWVVATDVIEHVENPAAFLLEMRDLLKPAGRLCIKTPNADRIDLGNPEKHLHTLHMPYHTHILSAQALLQMGAELNFTPIAYFRRHFMNSWLPGTSDAFAKAFARCQKNDFDVYFEPPRPMVFLRHPVLAFHFLFGYLFPPSKDEMMMVFEPTSPN